MDPETDATLEQCLNSNQFLVDMNRRFADYVRARAEAHGETPEQHIYTIVRTFWANHDEWRRLHSPGAARPGKTPVAA